MGDDRDRLGQAGFCVTPMHQSELLEALAEMCEDDDMRRKMGATGRRRVESFYNLQGMIQNYQAVYQKAIKRWQA